MKKKKEKKNKDKEEEDDDEVNSNIEDPKNIKISNKDNNDDSKRKCC